MNDLYKLVDVVGGKRKIAVSWHTLAHTHS